MLLDYSFETLCSGINISAPGSLATLFPLQFTALGLGVPFVPPSPSLLLFSLVVLSSVVQKLFSPAPSFQFFKRKRSIKRCNVVCSMQGVISGSSYIAISDSNLWSRWILKTLKKVDFFNT